MLSKGLDMLAGCATPLALLSIGAGFEGAKAIKKLGPTCAATFIKLVLLPAIFLPIAAWMGFRDQAMVALVDVYKRQVPDFLPVCLQDFLHGSKPEVRAREIRLPPYFHSIGTLVPVG